MKNVQSEVILELTKKLTNLFGSKKNQGIKVNLKDDNSFVTEIDLFVSNLLKQKLNEHSLYKSYSFFSEEEFGELHFPCAILDPIDGTRELVKGRAECAVSLGLMHTPLLSDSNNYGWLYNPFSGFNMDSSTPFIASDNKSAQKILGMVSRSEFEKGHFKDFANMNPKYDITPRGSIAFKLGLLASGGCDFVLSLSPKNIWDIAGGSILCAQRGIGLYQNGTEIKSLAQVKMNGILLWATPDLAQELWQQIKLVHK